MTASAQALRPRRTQAERRDQSERLLLAAAAELVGERGVGAATFENIGQRAGYSRGLATQKFGSKQGLIEALIAQLQTRQGGQLDDRDVDEAPALEAILAYVDVFLRSLAEDTELRAYFILMAGAIADLSDQRGPFADAHVQVERRLEALVQRGQAEGTIRPEIDADAAALMIGSLLLGLSMQLLIDPKMNLEPIREISLAALRQSFAAA
ncbi:TetR/AcrR family transcriptional regulator [Phenylobacterium sp.]|uniref:TetR/AcrR family transcriptional regulator n=1 Tax=Phenylobacterium sp. TaxID=1871053 RepID=UPI0035B17FB0